MVSAIARVLLLSAAVADLCDARSEYRTRLPNSHNVVGVDAIGHLNPKGDGRLNQFGVDFKANGRKWTRQLCNMDSDGDGQTNGQELGDPCCVWVKRTDDNLLWTNGLSNPGDATSKSDATQWPNVTCSDNVSDASASVPSPDSMSVPLVVVSAFSIASLVLGVAFLT